MLRNGAGVGVRRHDRCERLLDLLAKAAVGARFILRGARGVGRPESEKWLVPEVKAPGTMIEVSMP